MRLRDARDGSSAVAQTLIGRIVVLGVNVINGVLSARYLGTSGRGLQAAMGLWPLFTCYILTLGVPIAVIFYVRKHEQNADAILSSAFVLSAALGALATIIGMLLMPSWLHKYDQHTVRLAQYLMLFAPQIMITMVMTAAYDVRYNFAAANILRFGPPIITLVILLGLVASHRFTPFASALAYATPPAIITLMLVPRLSSQFRFTLSDFRQSSRRLLGYGTRVYGVDIFSAVGTQIDQLLVLGLLAANDLGLYAVALSASRVLNIFQTSVTVVLLPKLVGLDTLNMMTLIKRATRLSIAFTLVTAVILIITLPVILPTLYGQDFSRAVFVAQILSVESVISTTTSVLVQAFMATNRPGIATALQGIGVAFAVPLMLALIPHFGLPGAAVALLGSTSIRFMLCLFCFPAILRVPLPNLLVGRADLLYMLQAVQGHGKDDMSAQ